MASRCGCCAFHRQCLVEIRAGLFRLRFQRARSASLSFCSSASLVSLSVKLWTVLSKSFGHLEVEVGKRIALHRAPLALHWPELAL